MKGGINFEEWKEIVKKNRRSLRSKSNSFKFEPESLTYGAEKAVKSPEYGQMHTITYNVTGMEIPFSWPTEIKSGKTLVLDGITAPYGATATVSASIPYTYENGVLTISNVQNAPNITINISDVLYQNANVGDYLYSDWTFGPTEKPGYLGRCIGGLLMVNGSNVTTKSTWVIISEQPMAWSTEDVDTAIPNYTGNALKNDMNGQEHTQTLLALGADKYPAAAWAAQQFNGLGYLPSAGELYSFGNVIRDLGFNSTNSQRKLWSSNETYSRYGYDKEAALLGSGVVTTTTALKSGSNYVLSFCKLSGPCGIPVNNNGHEYVDLGLPSGTLWASMNVGASSETDYGNYYMYGMGAKTYDSTDTPYDGTEDPLDLSKDTARVVWGGDWHMPTRAQMQELIDNTNNEWATVNNVNGYKFTSKTDSSKYIFLPGAGYWDNGSQSNVGGGNYWSSTPNDSYVCDLFFGDLFGDVYMGLYNGYRKCGFSVRGVIG